MNTYFRIICRLTACNALLVTRIKQFTESIRLLSTLSILSLCPIVPKHPKGMLLYGSPPPLPQRSLNFCGRLDCSCAVSQFIHSTRTHEPVVTNRGPKQIQIQPSGKNMFSLPYPCPSFAYFQFAHPFQKQRRNEHEKQWDDGRLLITTLRKKKAIGTPVHVL